MNKKLKREIKKNACEDRKIQFRRRQNHNDHLIQIQCVLSQNSHSAHRHYEEFKTFKIARAKRHTICWSIDVVSSSFGLPPQPTGSILEFQRNDEEKIWHRLHAPKSFDFFWSKAHLFFSVHTWEREREKNINNKKQSGNIIITKCGFSFGSSYSMPTNKVYL